MDNVTLIRIIAGGLAVSVFLLPLYILPTILAWKKQHRIQILLLNLLLGWTVLGWVGALVWALVTRRPIRTNSALGSFVQNAETPRRAWLAFAQLVLSR